MHYVTNEHHSCHSTSSVDKRCTISELDQPRQRHYFKNIFSNCVQQPNIFLSAQTNCCNVINKKKQRWQWCCWTCPTSSESLTNNYMSLYFEVESLDLLVSRRKSEFRNNFIQLYFLRKQKEVSHWCFKYLHKIQTTIFIECMPQPKLCPSRALCLNSSKIAARTDAGY